MLARILQVLALAGLLVVYALGAPTRSEAERTWQPAGEPPGASQELPPSQKPDIRIEAVVIHPYQSANVGSQVPGEIEKYFFEEGDAIADGQVVAEIYPRRYQLLVLRAEERLRALEAALKKTEEDARIKEELFDLDATTRQEVVRTKAEAEIARFRVAEAARELDLARFDFDSCKIKAPFAGHMAVRYKQPDESVERSEKVFAIVDSAKVHAVANVPEILLSEFKKGTKAYFVHGPDRKFEGVVDRISKLIDHKSKTKRIYLLLDNSNGELEVGMTGSLHVLK